MTWQADAPTSLDQKGSRRQELSSLRRASSSLRPCFELADILQWQVWPVVLSLLRGVLFLAGPSWPAHEGVAVVVSPGRAELFLLPNFGDVLEQRCGACTAPEPLPYQLFVESLAALHGILPRWLMATFPWRMHCLGRMEKQLS